MIEHNEELSDYLKKTKSPNPADRRGHGLAWYPIIIKSWEIDGADHILLDVKRTSHQHLENQFRVGSRIVLFSDEDPRNRIKGTITFQGVDELKIDLNTNQFHSWFKNEKLGIDILFDASNFEQMYKAIVQASNTSENTDEDRIVKILTGQTKPTFSERAAHHTTKGLNSSQKLAVDRILAAKDLVVIHGPPGTGKTTTLVQAIKALNRQDGKQILVVAPSNTAVDLLTNKLYEAGLNVLRIGDTSRISKRIIPLTIEGKLARDSSIQQLLSHKKKAIKLRSDAQKYKQSQHPAEKAQRKSLFDEAYRIWGEVSKFESYIVDGLVKRAQVITATLVSSNYRIIRNLKYDTLIIDEAGQALEPACWIPILKAKKVVFSGDPCQLPPTVKSLEAAEGGLNYTLLEKIIQLHPQSVILLDEQYRMNEAIMGYPSSVFYGNKLKAHYTVAEHVLHVEDPPLVFIDTAGCGFKERSKESSTCNPEEATFLLKDLEQYVLALRDHYHARNFPTIAVISPYRQQVLLLDQLIQKSRILRTYLNKISVNTIDSFQGQERDVVYISMTRCNTVGNIGFLSNTRRMNVAMTRARKKLVIIGDSVTLSNLAFYSEFIDYAEQNNAYYSAWDFEYGQIK